MSDSDIGQAAITLLLLLLIIGLPFLLVATRGRGWITRVNQKASAEFDRATGAVPPNSTGATHDMAGPTPIPSVPEARPAAPVPAPLPVARVEAVAPAPILSQVEPPLTAPVSEQPKSIFISYRRQDSQHITGRIYDRLSSQFGKEAVFKDVDSIPLGYDFRDHLREQVSRCAVLVAVIGKNWNPPAASGDRRLSDPRDHLRIEIESALERHIPVIPVLVDGIEMPAEDELPAPLGRLAYHNGIAIRPDPDFHHDADRLARGIEMLFKQAAR